jgi:CHAD domain-containing protein
MPRFQKWLIGVAPEARADEVARSALTERLLAVVHFLDKSIGEADEAEAIHQLRVWTRRASAALKLFEPATPKSPRKWMKQALRKLRRTAGAVRDCDVHLQRLAADNEHAPKRVVRALKRERRQARQKLKALRRRLQKDDRLPLHIEQLMAGVAWPKRHSSREAPPFASFCRAQLKPLVREFFALAAANLKDDEKLHALRIAGKRLRYALELAPAAMQARVHRQLYAGLDEVQDRLGEVVDQLAAIDHLREWLDDSRKKRDRQRLRALLDREERRLSKLRATLLRWWSPARRAALRQQWQKALTGA